MIQHIRFVVENRRIVIPAPDEMPDGTQVQVELMKLEDRIGISESQWSDDPDALSDWNHWISTIEPVEFTPADDFDERFRLMNIDAARRQMSGLDKWSDSAQRSGSTPGWWMVNVSKAVLALIEQARLPVRK